MNKKSRFYALVSWRIGHAYDGMAAEDLSDSFSCERLKYEDVPQRFRVTLTSFRHLTQAARLSAVKSVLKEKAKPLPVACEHCGRS